MDGAIRPSSPSRKCASRRRDRKVRSLRWSPLGEGHCRLTAEASPLDRGQTTGGLKIIFSDTLRLSRVGDPRAVFELVMPSLPVVGRTGKCTSAGPSTKDLVGDGASRKTITYYFFISLLEAQVFSPLSFFIRCCCSADHKGGRGSPQSLKFENDSQQSRD